MSLELSQFAPADSSFRMASRAHTAGAPTVSRLGAVDILGVKVHRLDRASLTSVLKRMLDSGSRGWLSYVHVHAINLAYKDPWFKDYLNQSLVTYCDGEGVRLASRILGNPLPERIVMTDWMNDVCALAEREGYMMFLLGSTEEVNTGAVRMLRSRFPSLKISGNHGYFRSDETENLVRQINTLGTDILVVGMGMPIQEQWIAENFERINLGVVLNAGSCFDFIAGAKRRCPRWMGDRGLEWLYCLFQEPRRLWRRYLIGNPLFLYSALKQRFTSST